MEIGLRYLTIILIKQFKRICKWEKSLIFIGDMLIHRELSQL
jgi:hypothetical protein